MYHACIPLHILISREHFKRQHMYSEPVFHQKRHLCLLPNAGKKCTNNMPNLFILKRVQCKLYSTGLCRALRWVQGGSLRVHSFFYIQSTLPLVDTVLSGHLSLADKSFGPDRTTLCFYITFSVLSGLLSYVDNRQFF